jgi:hypothetical protein
MLDEKPLNKEQLAVQNAFKDAAQKATGFDRASDMMDEFMSTPEMQLGAAPAKNSKPV